MLQLRNPEYDEVIKKIHFFVVESKDEYLLVKFEELFKEKKQIQKFFRIMQDKETEIDRELIPDVQLGEDVSNNE